MSNKLALLQARCAANANTAKARAAANRVKHPEFTAFVDEFRKVFGAEVRVRWVRWPDGTEEGKRKWT